MKVPILLYPLRFFMRLTGISRGGWQYDGRFEGQLGEAELLVEEPEEFGNPAGPLLRLRAGCLALVQVPQR